MVSPSVKVYYFNATGRANMIRLALSAGGIPFEDDLASFPVSEETRSKWKELTNNNTTFSVPILTVDDKVYIQSSAALRKAGRLAGINLSLDDADQAEYQQDKLIADADDLRSASYKAFVMFGAKKEAAEKFIHEVFPKHVDNLERQLVAMGGDYFGGSSKLSTADVALYDAIVFFGNRLIEGIEGIESPCGPALQSWIKRVESNEGIAKYLESEQFKALAFVPDKTAIGY